jgi:quercetin dioxygenase-like cupin family protein
MSNFADYRERTGANPDKFFKSTLFRSPHLLLGLNCLEPGQTQRAHTHADQDKFYFVVEGAGEFVIGDETRTAGAKFLDQVLFRSRSELSA